MSRLERGPGGAADLRSRYAGCLVGGAIGDALGRPGEGRSPDAIAARYGELRDFHKWRGWQSGPIGTITDDTQLTMAVARTYLACGRLDPADLGERVAAWLDEGRGKGSTCTQAAVRLKAGVPWSEAGIASAGNGAAMRAAPIGLVRAEKPALLREEARLATIVTHADGMAVASSVAIASAVADLLRLALGTLHPRAFLESVAASLDAIPDPGHPERRPGADPKRRMTFAERILALPDMLHLNWRDAMARTYNGAFVLESVPAALWFFTAYRDDPEEALVRAASAGYDADTVAAMAGNMAGAYHGLLAFPGRWLDELEYRDELIEMSEGLWRLAGDGALPGGTETRATAADVSVYGAGAARDLSHSERTLGCLLGGALGDALGAPIEFLSLAQIRQHHGAEGLRKLVPAYGRLGAITDDTQMTLFTTEGLIRAAQRIADRGICSPDMVLEHAYWRWLRTQGYDWGEFPVDHFPHGDERNGWLLLEPVLHERRAPGNTCLSSLLKGGGPYGNDSKGCGGVMRMAPVGLTDRADPYGLGMRFAAITHGHPTGQIAAGALALIVRELVKGSSLEDAAHAVIDRLPTGGREGETRRALEAAIDLATGGSAQPPSAERVETLGAGWIAEEALAIGLYAALVAKDVEHGLCLGVNHSGDSDSTGSIAGNLLGAWWGVDALPAKWVAQLEARDVIERLAEDFSRCFGPEGAELDWGDYPPW